jgi:hypothetical protein
MSNKKKITLEEVRDLYAKNEGIREFLESKFSMEELTASTTSQEVVEEPIEQKFKRVWEEKILTQCDSVRFLDINGVPTKIPTSRIQVLNKEGLWLFEYDPSGKNKTFWYSYQRIYVLLTQEVSSDGPTILGLIKSWVESSLGLQGAIPTALNDAFTLQVEDTLGLQGAVSPLHT